MYEYMAINNTQIYFFLLLLTLNIPLETGKCTRSGTRAPHQ